MSHQSEALLEIDLIKQLRDLEYESVQIQDVEASKKACCSNYLCNKIPIFHFYESIIPILQIKYLFFTFEIIPVIHIR
jgi:hypothetical protein